MVTVHFKKAATRFKPSLPSAAWATVLSQLLSAALCLVYLLRRDRDLLCTRYECHFEKSLVKRTLIFGFSSALHQSTLYIGKIFVQGAVNTLGTPGIAAYTATMRIEGFANSFGTSVGQALSVFVSQNVGAGNPRRVRAGLKNGMGIGIAMGVVFSLLMYLSAAPGMHIFLDASEGAAIAHGTSYLRQIAFFYILCFTGNNFVGFFRGAGRVYVPIVATTLHISIRVALSYLLAASLGLRAVAIATGVGWMAMTVYQLVMLRDTNKRLRELLS